MYTYTIKGEARPHKDVQTDSGYEENQELTSDEMEMLGGVDCQEDFVYYMDGPLANKMDKERGAYMEFKYDPIKNRLVTCVTYTTLDILTSEEEEELIAYTRGQWSDGIGEGFEQHACRIVNDSEYYISP